MSWAVSVVNTPQHTIQQFKVSWNPKGRKTKLFQLHRLCCVCESEIVLSGGLMKPNLLQPASLFAPLPFVALHTERCWREGLPGEVRPTLTLTKRHRGRRQTAKQLTCCNWRVVFCFCPGSFCRRRPSLRCRATVAALVEWRWHSRRKHSRITAKLRLLRISSGVHVVTFLVTHGQAFSLQLGGDESFFFLVNKKQNVHVFLKYSRCNNKQANKGNRYWLYRRVSGKGNREKVSTASLFILIPNHFAFKKRIKGQNAHRNPEFGKAEVSVNTVYWITNSFQDCWEIKGTITWKVFQFISVSAPSVCKFKIFFLILVTRWYYISQLHSP